MSYKRYFVVVLGLFACVCFACSTPTEAGAETDADLQASIPEQTPSKPMLISEEEFKQVVMDFSSREMQFRGKKPCVIDFYADWCRPCRMLAPLFEAMSEKYGGKVDFYKVNVDSCPNLTAIYNITGIPALFFYDKDGTPFQMVGIPSAEELEEAINTVIR